jgi:hypothetical protein
MILNSGKTCHHSVQRLLPSRLLAINVETRIYKTVIFPVVLYGCETWSLDIKEEYTLKVFDNRVLRRIFVSLGDEVMGDWMKPHSEELHDF